MSMDPLWSEESHFNKQGGILLKLTFLLAGLWPYVTLVSMEIWDFFTSAPVMWDDDSTHGWEIFRVRVWKINPKQQSWFFFVILTCEKCFCDLEYVPSRSSVHNHQGEKQLCQFCSIERRLESAQGSNCTISISLQICASDRMESLKANFVMMPC